MFNNAVGRGSRETYRQVVIWGYPGIIYGNLLVGFFDSVIFLLFRLDYRLLVHIGFLSENIRVIHQYVNLDLRYNQFKLGSGSCGSYRMIYIYLQGPNVINITYDVDSVVKYRFLCRICSNAIKAHCI